MTIPDVLSTVFLGCLGGSVVTMLVIVLGLCQISRDCSRWEETHNK